MLAAVDVACTIVVNLADYADAQQAADAYKTVNWFDAKKQDDNICRNAFAALELQRYLAQILQVSPAQLAIVNEKQAPERGSLIFIGAPVTGKFKAIARTVRRNWRKNKKSGEQSFRLDTFSSKSRKGLVLSGESSVGILYGVYELLGRWGVRWYTPDADGVEAPVIDRINLFKVHEFVTPSFSFRGFWMDSQRPPDETDPLFCDWMGRNRINFFWNQEKDAAALKLRGMLLNTGSRNAVEILLTPHRPYRYNHPKFTQDNNLPTDPYMISERYQGDINNDGQLNYGEAHPEWFDVQIDSVNASQDIFTTIGFCPSQPDALKEFARLILEEMSVGQWRTCDVVDIWAPDAWCSCVACKKMGNGADKLLYLLYNVDKIIQEARKNGALGREIYIFGYGKSNERTPPTMALPGDFSSDHTAVFLSTWPRCYSHHMISTECININLWFMKELLGWLDVNSVYQGQVGITENYNAEAFRGLPTLYSKVMSVDIPAFAELGITGVNFMHTRTRDLGVNALLNYQFARQTWNSDVSVDTLKAEFFKLIYSEVSDLIQEYYSDIEKSMSTITTWTYYMPLRAPLLFKAMQNDSTNRRMLVTEQFDWLRSPEEPSFNALWENSYHLIFDARYLLDAALSKTASAPVIARILELEEELQYAELMINTYDNIITFFTSGPDEEDIRVEAIYRLRENHSKLADFTINTPLNGPVNGLAASGIEELINELLREYANVKSYE